MATWHNLVRGPSITAALAERIEAARRAVAADCARCVPGEACSQHIAERLVNAVRADDLVLAPLDRIDALIEETVERLVAERGGPAGAKG